MALDTTVAGETSDSYASVAEADAYFTAHYSTAKNTAWSALTTPRKESALKRATQQIETIKFLDVEYAVVGRLPLALIEDVYGDIAICKYEEYQRLQFPRNVDVDSSDAVFIPQEVKDAQCEQAVHLLTFDDAALLTIGSGIAEEAVTAGSVKSYTRYVEGVAPSYLSPMAAELLRPYFRRSSKMRRT